MTCCSTRFLRTFSWGVVECMTVEAAELVIATSGLELRAVVVDQNLEGHARELAAFARKISALNFVLTSGNDPPRLPKTARFLRKPFMP